MVYALKIFAFAMLSYVLGASNDAIFVMAIGWAIGELISERLGTNHHN